MHTLYHSFPNYWIMPQPYSYPMFPAYQWMIAPNWDKPHKHMSQQQMTAFQDFGPEPFVINIERATENNRSFRTALWTGRHLQLTLMSINIGDDIGLELHPNTDQFLRIEEGCGIVMMGRQKEALNFKRRVSKGDAIFIPAGTWHNVCNVGNRPLKLYSIYAPIQHPHGTVHHTKASAMAAEPLHA